MPRKNNHPPRHIEGGKIARLSSRYDEEGNLKPRKSDSISGDSSKKKPRKRRSFSKRGGKNR